MIGTVNTGILATGLGVLVLFAAFRLREGRGNQVPDVPVASFDGTRVEEDGVVAVVFHARWCPYARMFGELFDRWEPPEGVERRIGDVTADSSPLWDDFGVAVTPSIALFKDGELVWKRNGARMRGLDEKDLKDLDAEARRLVHEE